MALLVEGHQLKAVELAERLDTTPGFVPQVIGPLVKAGWVRSDPGPAGGYALTGSPADVSVLDVIEAINRLLGTRIEPRHLPARKGDVCHSCADISLARRFLGFEPRIGFEEGLRRAIDYYRAGQ